MTTVELRTSIVAELDQMSAEMLENVSRYVKQLRRLPRSTSRIVSDHTSENADNLNSQLSPRVLQFKRGNPWYASDEEIDLLRQEYLMKKYQ